MRPVSRKLYSKINEKGMTLDNVLEFVFNLSPQEKKKSFPDDCLFQRDRYFADIILKELSRAKLIIKEGNLYHRVDKQQETKNSQK